MKALVLAERAALGTLLLHPTAAPTLPRWLRAGDFADPWHREVYRSLRELRAAAPAAGPTEVGAHLLERLGPTRADLARVAGLVRAAPPGAADPRHYAAMVLEAAIRRDTPRFAVLLQAGALAATTDGTARPMLDVTTTVDSLLDAAEYRWQASQRDDDGRQRPGRIAGLTDRCLAADRFLQAHPRPDRTQIAEHEAKLVAALLTHPGQLHATACWLRPDALTNRAWRPVYAAMLHLHTHGNPVEVVSVAWEVQRSSRANGPGPDAAMLTAATEAAVGADPGYWGRIVAGDHLRRAADQAAESLRATAANPGVGVEDLLSTGHLLTDALRTAARPLGTPDEDRAPRAMVHTLPAPRRTGPVAG